MTPTRTGFGWLDEMNELEKEVERLRHRIAELEAENKKLRDGIKQYFDLELPSPSGNV